MNVGDDELKILASAPQACIPARRLSACLRLAALCGALAVLVGVSVLVGWAIGSPALRAWVPGWVGMQPWGAVAFILSGIALLAHLRAATGLEIGVGGLVALISLMSLFNHFTAMEIPFERLLFTAEVEREGSPHPGRMTDMTTVLLLVFVLGLWAASGDRFARLAWAINSLGLAIAATGAMGYLFGAHRLSQLGAFDPFALPATSTSVLLFMGASLAAPYHGWMRSVISPGLGGTALRRLAPVAVGLPVASGLLIHRMVSPVDLQPGFGIAVAMLVVMFGLCVTFVWFARQLDRVDALRIRVMADLERSEAAFRASQDVSLFGIMFLDAMREAGTIVDFRQRYVNPAALRLIGREKLQENITLSRCVLHGDGGMLAACIRVVETGEPLDAEFRVQCHGQTRWFRNMAVKLGDGVAVSFYDITDRLVAERALARAEAHHRAVVETAADAIVVIDEAGRVMAFNRAAEHIFGYTAAEALGQNIAILMPEPHRSAHDGYLRSYKCTGTPGIIGIGRTVTGRRKDGAIVQVDLAVAEWRDDGERFFTGIMRDVSARHQAEEALRKSEARFRTILDQAAVGIIQVSLTSTRLLGINRRFSAMLGYDEHELIGMSLAELVAPEYRAADAAMADELRGGRQSSPPTEKQFLCKDGSRVWVRVTSSVPEGEADFHISVVEDISEYHRTLAALRRARDEAQQANRAKSTFLAAASHDLRQPVQAMVLLNEALLGRLRDHPARSIVSRLQASVNALQMLLDGLLDVSRLDAGVVEVHRTDVPVGVILERLHAEYAVRCKPRGLRLRVVPCTAWMHTDPALFERVLRNLIENAIRYTRTGSILVGCRHAGPDLLVGVYDTGIGIPPDKLELIFQEFYQISNPERDREKGLGLGLSIVSRLANLLGHSLRVASVPGKGSAFVIRVPRVEPAASPPPRKRPSAARVSADILVIDDEALIRDSLAAVLEAAGWRVRTAGDAAEAVQAAAASPPDIILADYRLREGRTGIAAVRAVESACGRAIPTIVLTGDTDPLRIAEVTRSGYRIAHKPVMADRLVEMICASLGRMSA